MVTEEQVREALSQVFDPELGLNVVDLGLIYTIDISDGRVKVEMTLTTEGCPLHNTIPAWVREAVEALPGVEEAQVEVVWSPPWTPERMSAKAREELGMP